MNYLKQPLLTLVLFTLVFASCHKGKKMPEPVPVAIDFSTATVSINNSANMFYTPSFNEEDLMYMFEDDLIKYLGENNVFIDQVNPKYVIKVKELVVKEVLDDHYFTDQCTFETVNYPTSTLSFDAEVVVFSRWTNSSMAKIKEDMRRREEVRDRTNNDECLDIRINELNCDVPCMSDKIAKRLRKHITRKIYRAEGF